MSPAAVCLERNVVVRSSTAHGRRLVEVGRVGGNIALRREPRAVPPVVPGTEELDGVGNDIDGLPLVALLVLPLARGVLAARVARDPQRADTGAARGAPQLRIPGEVPGEDDAVDVGGCHTALLQFVLDSRARLPARPAGKGPPEAEVAGLS